MKYEDSKNVCFFLCVTFFTECRMHISSGNSGSLDVECALPTNSLHAHHKWWPNQIDQFFIGINSTAAKPIEELITRIVRWTQIYIHPSGRAISMSSVWKSWELRLTPTANNDDDRVPFIVLRDKISSQHSLTTQSECAQCQIASMHTNTPSETWQDKRQKSH